MKIMCEFKFIEVCIFIEAELYSIRVQPLSQGGAMRPPGSAQALEVRRMIAVRTSSSVVRWKQALQSGGEEALKAKPHPGRRPKLSQSQKEVLEQILLQGPQAVGFSSQLWTWRE